MNPRRHTVGRRRSGSYAVREGTPIIVAAIAHLIGWVTILDVPDALASADGTAVRGEEDERCDDAASRSARRGADCTGWRGC